MDSDPTILFTCTCSRVLEAPVVWKGRLVQCLSCRATLTVPETTDPEAVRADAELVQRLVQARRQELSKQAAAWTPERPAFDDAPAPSPKPAEAPAIPKTTRRSWWIAAAAVVIVPSAILVTLWFVRERSTPHVRGSAAAAVTAQALSQMKEIGLAEEAYEKSGHARPQAQRLAELYRNAASIPGNPRLRAHVCNNAAWFYATCPDLTLREPERALSLARLAVELTAGSDPNILDTLAESLFLNGRHAEAVETQRKTLAMMPDAGADFLARYEKYQKALRAYQ